MNPLVLAATPPALLLPGCAGSPCRPGVGETGITPTIAASGDYRGRQVQWGGVLAEACSLKDRTELEVVGIHSTLADVPCWALPARVAS